jgi:two-component system nitrogen regulation response regulator NtrX
MAKILLIDDDALVRSSLKGILEVAGYDVALAANGRAGLEAFSGGDFDLVLTDIFMPEMEGLEFVRRLHAIHPPTRIVAMSGGPAVRDRKGGVFGTDYLRMAIALGATEAIRKPFSSQQLLKVVDAHLAKRLVEDEPAIDVLAVGAERHRG